MFALWPVFAWFVVALEPSRGPGAAHNPASETAQETERRRVHWQTEQRHGQGETLFFLYYALDFSVKNEFVVSFSMY